MRMNAPVKPLKGALGDALASNNGPRATMTDAVYDCLTKRIDGYTGIVFPAQKRQLVESRLRKRLRALSLADFETYIVYLDSPAGKHETGELINVVTTNLTSFFRESHHFLDMVEVLKKDAATDGHSRRIRIWSSACSTGEEPYSISIAALQAGLVTSGHDLRILATDLDTEALLKARTGIYPAQRLKTCPEGYRQNYFNEMPDEKVRVKEKVQKLIEFNHLNLHKSWPVNGPFDVIFCRNVMIYFGEEAKKAIVERFVKLLRPGGTLYLGHSESLLGSHPQLDNLGRTIFRKKSRCLL